MKMPEIDKDVDIPTPSSLQIYRSDVADMMERAGGWRLRDGGTVQGKDAELRYVSDSCVIREFCS